MRIAWILGVGLTSACAFEPSGTPLESGQPDAAPDATPDATSGDGAEADAMPIDAMPIDAMPVDAMPVDAMPVDAMPIDAMPIDAMPTCPGYVGGYRFVATSQTWREAEADCENDVVGQSHLVVINDSVELAVVAAIAVANARDVWVGVVRDGTDSTSPADWAWRWVTGGPATYLPWETGQPDNASGNQLVVTLIAASGRLRDIATTLDRAAICECDGRPPVAADYTP